jgi:hypothetical protein
VVSVDTIWVLVIFMVVSGCCAMVIETMANIRIKSILDIMVPFLWCGLVGSITKLLRISEIILIFCLESAYN